MHRRVFPGVMFFAVLFTMLASASADEPNQVAFNFSKPVPAPELNDQFHNTQGWIGGENATSVTLPSGRTLWLYGDTWVGEIKEGRRSRARVVHNSAGTQETPDSACVYSVRRNADGNPADLLSPNDGHGWFWFQAAVVVNQKLYLFMSQCDRTFSPVYNGSQQIEQWLGVIHNPEDDPLQWKVDQIRIPFTCLKQNRLLTFGTEAVADHSHLYVYGVDQSIPGQSRGNHLVLARVPLTSITDMNSWRFYSQNNWITDYQQSEHLANYMACEISVLPVPGRDQYLMVYTDGGVSNRIVARTATSLEGPWSDTTLLHVANDITSRKRLISYGARAHLSLSNDGDLVISYLASAVDPVRLSSDAELFWPRFLKVTVTDPNVSENASAEERVVLLARKPRQPKSLDAGD